MKFGTVINCMDGRTQLPVIQYLLKRFGVDFIDSITEPGPNHILSEQTDQAAYESIIHRLNISVDKHGSNQLAIVAHHDCAANPSTYEKQIEQIKTAIKKIKGSYTDMEIIGLWVDEQFEVHEIHLSTDT